MICSCGTCRKCKHRAKMRKWRHFKDLKCFLPEGYKSTLDPSARIALTLRDNSWFEFSDMVPPYSFQASRYRGPKSLAG